MKLAIIGGTGKQGSALARRFGDAGVEIVIGSREAARAQAKAAELGAATGRPVISGMSNREATAAGDVVILSVPYEGMAPILADIREAARGKIVVNMASALDPAHKSRALVPAAGSITAEVQQVLGESSRVVAAFQNVAPEELESAEAIDSDVLVCGADRATREQVIALIARAGIRALDAGVLANAVAVETLTAVLISINIRHKTKGAGIRITGI
jgi:NADPH-dependent F420 reductase